MKTQLKNKSEENKKLSKEFMKVTEEMARMRNSQPVIQVAPSLDHNRRYQEAKHNQSLHLRAEERNYSWKC